MTRAAFTGVGHSRVLRRPDEPIGLLALDACRAAIADAGLEPADIDGMVSAPRQPGTPAVSGYDGRDFVSADLVRRALGLRTEWVEDINGFLMNSVVAAIAAVGSGLCRHVLVCRALTAPSGKYGFSQLIEAGGPAQFDAPYGAMVPSVWAQQWTRYQQLYGTGTREQMATLVTQERRNGLLWPHGYWATHRPVPLTVEDYLSAPAVSTPLGRFDCDIPVHGAGAFVISAADAAADAPHAAWVRGLAPAGHANGNVLRPWPLEQERASGEDVAMRLWRRSGLRPTDIDLANVYDGFSIIALIWLECLGFCRPGEAFDFIQDGRIALDGELPVNTAGGNLGAGRMHGIPQLMDAILQVTGRSGQRQVADAQLAVVTIGQQSGGGALIVGSTPS